MRVREILLSGPLGFGAAPLSDSLGSCEEHLAHRMIQFRK
jgi:hypothetical protein